MLSTLFDHRKTMIADVQAPLDASEIQYSDEFLFIEAEIQKLQQIKPEEPNWNSIITQGMLILSSQGKHLKVITYVIAALYKKYAQAGLLTGLYAFGDILEKEKNDILPAGKRAKSRQQLIVWLSKFVANCRQEEISGITFDDLEEIKDAKAKVLQWYKDFHADVDRLAILAIYEHFIAIKSKMRVAKEEAERNQVQAEVPKVVEEVIEKPQINPIVKEEVKQKPIQKQEALNTKPVANLASSNQVELKEITDFNALRDYFIVLSSKRLESIETYQQFIPFALDTRRNLWSSIYYDSMDDYLKSVCLSDNFSTLYDWQVNGDILQQLIHIEKIFIENPFMIEIQFFYLRLIDQLYLKYKDEDILKHKKAILSLLSECISKNLDLFETSIYQQPMIPPQILEWIFTEVVQEYLPVFEPYIAKILPKEATAPELLAFYSELIHKTDNFSIKAHWILKQAEYIAERYSKLKAADILEEQVTDDKIIFHALKNNKRLQNIYQILVDYYENIDAKDVNKHLYDEKRLKIFKRIFK